MRILFVSSNSAEHYLDIEREQRALLKIAEKGGHFLKFLPAVTEADLNDELSRGKAKTEKGYDVLHFAGHGTEQGILLKTGDDEISEHDPDKVKPLTPPQLAELVGAGKEHVGLRLVVLNACDTHELVEGITGIVDEVIGTKWEVKDRSAKQFTSDFYEELSNHATVKDAFRKAARPDGPYTRPSREPSITLPVAEEADEGGVEGLGDFYDTFYGNYVDKQIAEVERDQRLNNYVFYGLMSIAVCLWVYLFHDAYRGADGVFWGNLKTALGNAFYPSTRAGEPDLFSLDGLWNRVQELEAFAPTLIAFFQRTVFFQTRPKLEGLRRLREAIRNWDDLPDEDQEMVRSAMHTSLKESLQA